MKKKLFIVLFVSLMMSLAGLFAQTNSSVDIDDEVYLVLQNAELRGYCEPLKSSRPYTEKYILQVLNEIKQYLEEHTEVAVVKKELSIIEYQIERFTHTAGADFAKAKFRYENNVLGIPVSIEVQNALMGNFSAGLYDVQKFNSYAFEVWDQFELYGDIGPYISYKNQTYLGAARTPLYDLGQYDIGYWLSTNFNSANNYDGECEQDPRYIQKLRDYSHLPYSYKKFWDGSVYAFKGGINAGGLAPWPYEPSLAFGMNGEVRASIFNDIIELGIGRQSREWAAMEQGSSLVLNSSARPFFAVDLILRPFKWLSLRTLTGVLEMPNRSDMLRNAYYPVDENGKDITTQMVTQDQFHIDDLKDYRYFQNAFSIGQLDIDFKYLHIDFGSSCIWPKRFELGYTSPTIDRVVYQNDVGDFDNLALFGNFKIRYPGFGYLWASLYLDELDAFLTKFWERTRAMYAFQIGLKTRLPYVPFATMSLRYTQVEPFCYTHQAINGTPWYGHYIAENYTNNGMCLGYYLPPNSQEFLFRIDMNPSESSKMYVQYQFITHGADFGSKAVPGSSLYSELPRYGRSALGKNRFNDGAYELTHVISLSGSYSFKKMKVPVELTACVGAIFDGFTSIEGDPVSIYGKDSRWSVEEPYYHVNNNEYFDAKGIILSVGLKVFGR